MTMFSSRFALIAVALIAPLAAHAQNTTATDTGAASEPPPPAAIYPREGLGLGLRFGDYSEARWNEDWRVYRDPAKRDDLLDSLKFIPLDQKGEVYVTLSGEARLRTALTTNPGLREGRAQRLDTLRLVGGADLHIGRNFRAYGELAHGSAGGVGITNPVGALANDLVVQQAFVEANADVAGLEVGARYGRQFFTDGSPYLISTRNGATILTPFNGVRGWVRGQQARADIFDLRATRLGTGGIDDDRIDRGRRFSGVSGGIVVPRDWLGGSKLFLDPFVWRYRQDARRWGAESAREVRHYAGTRLWGSVGRATIDWTVARQTGDYGNRDIDAWQLFTQQGVRLGEAAGAPRVGVRFDYASGGGAYDDGPMRNAFTPFGVPIFYAYQNVFNPVNMMALAPSVSVRKGKTTLTGELQFTWRATTRDAIYRANDLPYAGTQLGDARHTGNVWQVQLAHNFTPRLSILGRYEHLAAGKGLTDAGYASSDYFTAWLNFRF